MKSLCSKIKNKKLLLVLVVFICVIAVILTLITLHINSRSDLPEFIGSDTTVSDTSVVDLGNGLLVNSIGNYAGMFLEDGSDDIVANNMMLVLKNKSEKDLQLARINVLYEDYTAEFEATNIPSGASVVLLEKNRKTYSDEEHLSITANNVVFFESPMSIQNDIFQLNSGEGYIEVKNMSDMDVEGPIYVYYKNIADDTLYGGITYRAVVENTIPKGESVKVLTQHSTEKNTEIMQVINVN